MKNLRKLFFIGLLAIASSTLFAQGPPDPNGGDDPGPGNTPVGGRAVVSGGFLVLLALGAGYGGKKVYDLRKKASKSA